MEIILYIFFLVMRSFSQLGDDKSLHLRRSNSVVMSSRALAEDTTVTPPPIINTTTSTPVIATTTPEPLSPLATASWVAAMIAFLGVIIGLVVKYHCEGLVNREKEEIEYVFALLLGDAIGLDKRPSPKQWHIRKGIARIIELAFLQKYPHLIDPNSLSYTENGEVNGKQTNIKLMDGHVETVANQLGNDIAQEPNAFNLERVSCGRICCGKWNMTHSIISVSAMETMLSRGELIYNALSVPDARIEIVGHAGNNEKSNENKQNEHGDDTLNNAKVPTRAQLPRYTVPEYAVPLDPKTIHIEERKRLDRLKDIYGKPGVKRVMAISEPAQPGLRKSTLLVDFFLQQRDLGASCYWLNANGDASLFQSMLHLWHKHEKATGQCENTLTPMQRVAKAKDLLRSADLIVYFRTDSKTLLDKNHLLVTSSTGQDGEHEQTVIYSAKSCVGWDTSDYDYVIKFQAYDADVVERILQKALHSQLLDREQLDLKKHNEEQASLVVNKKQSRGSKFSLKTPAYWEKLWRRLANSTAGIPLQIQLLISMIHASDNDPDAVLRQINLCRTKIDTIDFKYKGLGAFILAMLEHLGKDHAVIKSLVNNFSLFLNLNGPNGYLKWLLNQLEKNQKDRDICLPSDYKYNRYDFNMGHVVVDVRKHGLLLNTFDANPVIRRIYLELVHKQLFAQGKTDDGYIAIFYCLRYLTKLAKALYYNYHAIDAKTVLIHCKSVITIALDYRGKFVKNSLHDEVDEIEVYFEFIFYYGVLLTLDDQHREGMRIFKIAESDSILSNYPQLSFCVKNAIGFTLMNLGVIRKSIAIFNARIAERNQVFEGDSRLALVWYARIADNLAQAYLYLGKLNEAMNFNYISLRFQNAVNTYSEEQSRLHSHDSDNGDSSTVYQRFYVSVMLKSSLSELFNGQYPRVISMGNPSAHSAAPSEVKHIVADALILMHRYEEGIRYFREILAAAQHIRTYATLALFIIAQYGDKLTPEYAHEVDKYCAAILGNPDTFGPLLCYYPTTRRLANKLINNCLDNGFEYVLIEPYLIAQMLEIMRKSHDHKRVILTIIHRYNELDQLSSESVDAAYAIIGLLLNHLMKTRSDDVWYRETLDTVITCISNVTFKQYLQTQLDGCQGVATAVASPKADIVNIENNETESSMRNNEANIKIPSRMQAADNTESLMESIVQDDENDCSPKNHATTRLRLSEEPLMSLALSDNRKALELDLVKKHLGNIKPVNLLLNTEMITYELAALWCSHWSPAKSWYSYTQWFEYIKKIGTLSIEQSDLTRDQAYMLFAFFIQRRSGTETILLEMICSSIHDENLRKNIQAELKIRPYGNIEWENKPENRMDLLGKHIFEKMQWHHASDSTTGAIQSRYSTSPQSPTSHLPLKKRSKGGGSKEEGFRSRLRLNSSDSRYAGGLDLEEKEDMSAQLEGERSSHLASS